MPDLPSMVKISVPSDINPYEFWVQGALHIKGGSVYRYRFHEPAAVGVNFAMGFLSRFFGVGGSFMRTPILVCLFNFPVRIAAAESLFALAFYSSMRAMVHLILANIEWFPTLAFSSFGLWIGAQLGARVSGRVSSRLDNGVACAGKVWLGGAACLSRRMVLIYGGFGWLRALMAAFAILFARRARSGADSWKVIAL